MKRFRVWQTTKRKVLLSFVFVGFVLLWQCYLQITRLEGTKHDPHFTGVNILGERTFVDKPVKRILYWTKFMSDDRVPMQTECLKNDPCDVKCELSSDHNDVTSADAVEFHLSDVWPDNWVIGTSKTVDFPTYRQPHQVWVLYNLDPPPNIFGDLSVINDVFNWTLWYRLDATIFTPYGHILTLSDSETIDARREIEQRDFYSEKSKGIIGVISNCQDRGRRYELIEEMQHYLPIDMFGNCYGRPCSGGQWHLDKCDVVHQYRFFLSFENSHCKDYVTEKYWHVLSQGLVPIVNWKYVNTSIVIPHSYINVYDFNSTEEACIYINKVMIDRNLYNSYFTWKQKYRGGSICHSCLLCRALHRNDRAAQVITDVEGWVKNDYCQPASKWNVQKDYLNSKLFDIFGSGRALRG